MSGFFSAENEIFNHLFKIDITGGVGLVPNYLFDEIPTDGMFLVDELGDFVPVQDPTIITDDPYFGERGGDIVIKTLI